MFKYVIKLILVLIFATPICKLAIADNPSNNNNWMEYNSPYIAKDGLDIAHITSNEIALWAQNTVSEIFTFTPQDYAQRLIKFKMKDFTKSGWLKYAKFLKESKTLEAVTEQNYSIASIVPTTPLIIDEKVINKEFHWIVKMKTGISFFLLTNKGEKRTIKSGDYILYMDIKRTEKSSTSNELEIAINDIRLTPNIKGK